MESAGFRYWLENGHCILLTPKPLVSSVKERILQGIESEEAN
jgi:hypothetical protein